MGIKVHWYNRSQTVVMWVYDPAWTVGDFQEAVRRTISLTAEVPQFDIVADVSRTNTAPARAISTIHRFHLEAPSSFGVTFVFKANPFIKSILYAAMKMPIIHRRYIFAESTDELKMLLQANHDFEDAHTRTGKAK